MDDVQESSTGREWTFLTHHALVLLAVAEEPDARVVDIAARIGLSARAALSILGDLETAGYLARTRVGRRTHYEVHPGRPFRHRAAGGHDVDELIALFTTPR